MPTGVLRLLPLPLGLAGGALGGLLWWVMWLLNPELWRDLDEVEGYIIFGAIFLGWGLIHGVVYLVVPPFRARDPMRFAVSYRMRRALWLYALPMLSAWGAAIVVAVFFIQPGLGWPWEAVLASVILAMTLLGTAWVTQECCDWILPALPRGFGAVVTAGAILVLSLSLGTVLVLCTPYAWELIQPRGNITAMAAALDFLENDLKLYTVMMIGPAVHGGVLATLVPVCEAVWKVPAPRRRDLGAAPWFLFGLPVLAAFDLLAVTIWMIVG